jgi:hypothetical protein
LKKADDNVDDEDDDIKDSFGLKAEQLFFVTYAHIWCRKQTEVWIYRNNLGEILIINLRNIRDFKSLPIHIVQQIM